MTIVFAVMPGESRQIFTFNWQIGAAEVVVAGAELVVDDDVETVIGPMLTLEEDVVLKVEVLLVELVDVLWLIGPTDSDELVEDDRVLTLEEVELLVL